MELLPGSAGRSGEVPPDRVHLPAQEGVKGYDDITPRVGAAYDVFGNGKTSLKVNVGKYLEAATNHNTYSLTNPTARMVGSPCSARRRRSRGRGPMPTATSSRTAIC